MKKLILKTALITFGITFVIALSVFGIFSFVAPSAMMRLCASLGLENISGDYAYQEYQRNGDLDYLAHAFEIAAKNGKDVVAAERFDEFYGEEGSERRERFAEYCLKQSIVADGSGLPEGVLAYNYRSFVCSQAALVKYRLAKTDMQKAGVCSFAVSETGAQLTADSPVAALAAASVKRADKKFCTILLDALQDGKFDTQNNLYIKIVKTLEEMIHE